MEKNGPEKHDENGFNKNLEIFSTKTGRDLLKINMSTNLRKSLKVTVQNEP